MKAKSETNLFQDFDRWWFGRGSPVTLGFFRILVTGLAFISMAMALPDFELWYGSRGYVPTTLIRDWIKVAPVTDIGPWHIDLSSRFDHFPRIAPLSAVDSTSWTLVFYVAVMLFALLSCVGLWTRISTILLALGTVAIHHRNPFILHSGDTLMRCCLIYLAVSPSGKACSLDRVIGLWKGKEPLIHVPVSLWSQRLIQYQTALVYFTTVWWKYFGTFWKDGTATWYPAKLHEFDRFPMPAFLERQPFLSLTTYGTLLVEFSIATLIFYRPLRRYVVISAIMMHGYIEYRFNIPLFAFTIMATYLCFYDGEEIVAFAHRLGRRLKRKILLVTLPVGQKLRLGPGYALHAMDPLGLVKYEAGVEPDWQAVNNWGRHKNPATATLWRSLGAWPLALVPGLWKKLLNRALEPAKAEPTAQPAELQASATKQ